MVAAAVTQLRPTRNRDLTRSPIRGNGEIELVRVMKRLGLRYKYERWHYALGGVGFTPDFNVGATATTPRVNLELTWADRDLGTRRHEHAERILGLKRWKIQRTWELYGSRTVLITFQDWLIIMANPAHLIHMIEQEFARDYAEAAA